MGDRGTRLLALFALPKTRRTTTAVLAVAAAVVAGLFAASLVGRTVDIGPLTLITRMSFGVSGQTTLKVPPFGEATAATHRGPARFVVSVEEVDVPEVERLLVRPSRSQEVPGIRTQTQAAEGAVSEVLERESRSVGQYLFELVLLASTVACLASAFVAWALRRRKPGVVTSALISLVLVIGSGALAGATYDPTSLAAPRLQGALSYLPQLQSVFSTRLERIEELREQAARVAENLAAYYADPRSIVSGGGLPGTYRVLHVSDLHLDPVGAELSRSLARSYDASLVIDSGDSVILGGNQELNLLPSLVVTSTPVLFVPGNHDNPEVAERLSRERNVTVAATGTVTIDGLRIYTLPDPSGSSTVIRPDEAEIERVTAQTAAAITSATAEGLPPPDIIVTHSPSSWNLLQGLAPLVLAGHTHRGLLERGEQTVFLNSGTIGGMPYDPVVTGRDRLPHGASVLYYTVELPRRLIAIDRISVGVDGTTELDRRVIDESLLP